MHAALSSLTRYSGFRTALFARKKYSYLMPNRPKNNLSQLIGSQGVNSKRSYICFRAVLTSVVYASTDYLVTLDCFRNSQDFVNEKSCACQAEQAELTIYGRRWSLDPQTRDKLMTVISQRTLACYATSALIDIQPNGLC